MGQGTHESLPWQRGVGALCSIALLASACSSSTPGMKASLTRPMLVAQERPSEATSAAAKVAQPGEPADWQDVLAMLRADDAVIPARPPVHPLHTVYNREATIPAMCYTRTEQRHNPCYVCHQDRIGERPNRMDDAVLQRVYEFSELGSTNHWKNLFEDRTARVAAISDEEISAWISVDNYSELAGRLRAVEFKGYVPDLANLQLGAAAFDDEGFARDGSHWVAFNYKPLPSTFWPTNGSTDDVMIRLPSAFRTTREGVFSRDIYKANLALVEANLKGLTSISVRALDEAAVGSDLNGDGALGKIDSISNTADYVGAAAGSLKRKFLYPRHTEFLHSVRYIGVDPGGRVFVPPRMKELRYMRKFFERTEPQLYEAYLQERSEKAAGELPGFIDRGQHGLDNELGWVLLGFIENRSGQLRVANYEENLHCMGCHSSVGSSIDSTFGFARKIDGAAGWGYIDLHGMPDAPNMGESQGEIATYLERVGGGSEFRNNPEMLARWFKGGALDRSKLVGKDVYELVAPSRRRALDLNKAYRSIVDDQDFIHGRDATLTAPANVYEHVDPQSTPTLPESLSYRWDIRLDWSRTKLGAASKPRP